MLKKVVCILAVTIVFIFFVSKPAISDEKNAEKNIEHEIGRYQLFQGAYQFVNLKGEEFWSKGLFKIDTATGKIYECRMTQFKDPETGQNVQHSNCFEIFSGEKIPLGK